MKIMHDENKHKFFGETARYLAENGFEKEEAREYLELRKKFLVRRLNSVGLDEQWGDKPAMYDGALYMMNTMYLKLYIEGKWDYELGKN